MGAILRPLSGAPLDSNFGVSFQCRRTLRCEQDGGAGTQIGGS